LLDQLTSAQLSEWEAYDRLDPVGEWRADFRAASLMSVITNIIHSIFHDPEKGDLITTVPNDFIPQWGMDEEEEEKQEEEKVPDGMFRSLTKDGWVVRKKQTVDEIKKALIGITKLSKVRRKRKK